MSIRRSTSSSCFCSVLDMANSPDIAALIPAEALQEIGRLIINWSQVESVFDLIFLRIVVMEGKESMTMDDPKFKEMAHGIKRRCKRLVSDMFLARMSRGGRSK